MDEGHGNATTQAPYIAYGLPGHTFELVHGISITTLLISIIISTGVLIYLKPRRTFFSWPIGDRIVVYMAVCDEIYSWNVLLDQIVMLAVRDHVPDGPCAFFAFFLNEAIISQSLVVIFAALNAFTLVVYRKKLETGRGDWRLLVSAFGGPALLGFLGVATDSFGPSGAWCYIDMRKPLGPLLNTIVTIIMMVTFVFTVVCYGGIWLKIRQATANGTGNKKYHRTAAVMMVFIAAYILQWWAAVLYGLWGMFEEAPITVVIFLLTFDNLGGLWNFFAYTYIRKRNQGVGSRGGNNDTAAESTMEGSVDHVKTIAVKGK